jgi:hypothetical protein
MEIMKFENFTYPRGWVNIKVDDDMYIRMARYVMILDKILVAQPNSTKRDKYDLQKKVDLLSNIDILISDQTISVKDKISLITILQYLNELRNNFNDSSAGFLLEGFLAALIHGKLVGGRDIADIEGKAFLSDEEREKLKIQTLSKSYTELDVAEFESMPSDEDRGERRLKYQIKLYAQDSNIKINVGKQCDYYVICLKRLDRNIDVHIVKYEQIIDEKFAAVKKIQHAAYKPGGDKNDPERNVVTKQLRNTLKRYVEVNTKRLQDKNNRKVTLTISDLDKKIKDCAKEIKLLIDEIYLKISDLHFDIDSLVTGIDKNNKEISSEDAEKSAISTIADITEHLTNLSKGI